MQNRDISSEDHRAWAYALGRRWWWHTDLVATSSSSVIILWPTSESSSSSEPARLFQQTCRAEIFIGRGGCNADMPHCRVGSEVAVTSFSVGAPPHALLDVVTDISLAAYSACFFFNINVLEILHANYLRNDMCIVEYTNL